MQLNIQSFYSFFNPNHVSLFIPTHRPQGVKDLLNSSDPCVTCGTAQRLNSGNLS